MMRDALDRELVTLTPLVPDPRRAALTRQRMAEALDRRARRSAKGRSVRIRAGHVAAPLLLGALCVLYAATLLGATFQAVWHGR